MKIMAAQGEKCGTRDNVELSRVLNPGGGVAVPIRAKPVPRPPHPARFPGSERRPRLP
jgi:hypothetical protein